MKLRRRMMKVSDGALLTRILTHGSKNLVYNFTYVYGDVQGRVVRPNAFANECAEFFFDWFEELNKENNET